MADDQNETRIPSSNLGWLRMMFRRRSEKRCGSKPGALVFDLRQELRRQKRTKRRSLATLIGGGLLAGAIGGLVGTNWPTSTASAQARAAHTFAVCGTIRQTCVVDGDTIWLEGAKIRIADIDTPEISSPQCDAEYERGIRARDRLVVLLNEGEFELRPIGNRDEDQYGRKLRVILRSGRSLGDQLVSENLARTWTGRREPWC
jgi:endonuclease YncB( thermonuclease family)